jgi:5-methylthioadenosine/S-adenosylhomocysteine deaminase
VGVHVHVAEDGIDEAAGARLAPRSAGDWLLAHCVHLETDAGVRGTIAHNASSNLNNAVGYAAPARFANRVALGTDGIGGGVVEEYRVAFLALRAHDVTASPEMPWRWLEAGWDLVPEARADRVTWGHAGLDRLGPGPDAPGPDGPGLDPWTVAYTPGIRPVDVEIDGEVVLHGGRPTRVDPDEVRARAREEAERLWARL